MNAETAVPPKETRFFALALWLCAGASLWLLLSPAAFARREKTLLVQTLRADVRQEWIRNVGLERWRAGLEDDRSVIEREARKLGYGRPGEKLYLLSPAEVRAIESRLRVETPDDNFSWTGALGQSIAPSLLLLILGILAVLFFTDLKVEEPAPAAAPEDPTGPPG